MVEHAKVATIVHVPGHYIYDPTDHRQRYLCSLEGRLAIVGGLPKGPLGRRCAWLVIASSPHILRQLVIASMSFPFLYSIGRSVSMGG